MTLRVAIAGFGAIGKVVAQRLDQGIDGLTFTAVAARDNARAQEVYRRLGMVDSGYAVFEVDWSNQRER